MLVLLLIVFTLLAFAPDPVELEVENGDKLNHVAAYAVLAWTAGVAVAPRSRNLLAVACGLLAHGGAVELVQTQLPHRNGDWADLLADAAGIAVGLAVVTLLRRRRAAGPPGA